MSEIGRMLRDAGVPAHELHEIEKLLAFVLNFPNEWRKLMADLTALQNAVTNLSTAVDAAVVAFQGDQAGLDAITANINTATVKLQAATPVPAPAGGEPAPTA